MCCNKKDGGDAILFIQGGVKKTWEGGGVKIKVFLWIENKRFSGSTNSCLGVKIVSLGEKIFL